LKFALAIRNVLPQCSIVLINPEECPGSRSGVNCATMMIGAMALNKKNKNSCLKIYYINKSLFNLSSPTGGQGA
jgi:hypothetical protein